MKILIGKNTWFAESDLRLDASFHLSDTNRLKLIYKKSPFPFSTIDKQAKKIFSGNIFRRTYVSDPQRGIPYITGSDMMKSDIDSGKYLSKKQAIGLQNLMLKKGWILVTCSGTLGNTLFTNELFEGRIATHDLIRIIPNNKDIKEGFLYAYLSSKYGYSLLTQSSYGGVVKHIEPHHIANIPVPIFPGDKQEAIHLKIIQSSDLRVEAERLLKESEHLLLNELKITQNKEQLFDRSEKIIGNIFTVNKNDLSTLSFRARNYSPRKQKILEFSKKYKYQNLIDVLECSPTYGARFKRIEASNQSVELLSQGDIFNFKPRGRMISRKNIHNIENEFVKKGTILIPAQGTLGENEIFARAKFVWGYLENKLVAGHAMRFIPNPKIIGEGYLFTVLSSKMWFRLLRNSVYGTNLLGFIIPFLNEYPIPRFDNGIEQIIDEKVKNAYNKLTMSIDMENQAIQLVEKEIEQWQQ